MLAALFPPFFVGPGPDALRPPSRRAVGHSTGCLPTGESELAPHAGDPAPNANHGRRTQYSNCSRRLERRGVLEDPVWLRMDVLFDLVVPFVDAGGSFCLRWHDGLNGEGDLALTLWESMGCTSDFEENLGGLW